MNRKIANFNRQLRHKCRHVDEHMSERVVFLDAGSKFGLDGRIIASMYIADGLHLSHFGYEVFMGEVNRELDRIMGPPPAVKPKEGNDAVAGKDVACVDAGIGEGETTPKGKEGGEADGGGEDGKRREAEVQQLNMLAAFCQGESTNSDGGGAAAAAGMKGVDVVEEKAVTEVVKAGDSQRLKGR